MQRRARAPIADRRQNNIPAQLRVTLTSTGQPIFIIITPARIFPTAVLRNRARRRVAAILWADQKKLRPAIYRFTLTATALSMSAGDLRQGIHSLLL